MNTEHLQLRSAAAPESARWREAFPAGRSLPLPELLARLRQPDSAPLLVWLHSAEGQWGEQLRLVLEAQPQARVLLLSNAPQAEEGLLALNAGVRGYTHAYAVSALLQEVALVVGHGGLWVGPELLQRLVGSTHAALARSAPSAPAAALAQPLAWGTLSLREAEVARIVATGRSNREVAEQLFISERTVKAHLSAAFEKLGVRDRLQLVLSLQAVDAAAPLPPAKATP